MNTVRTAYHVDLLINNLYAHPWQASCAVGLQVTCDSCPLIRNAHDKRI